jgi:hypothetical protein
MVRVLYALTYEMRKVLRMNFMFIYPRIVQKLVHDNHSSGECDKLGVGQAGRVEGDAADGAVEIT